MKNPTLWKPLLYAAVPLLPLAAARPVQAVNPDTMTLSVTPLVTYAVAVTSVNAGGYQFGTVALGASTVSTAAISVRNAGNISEYFALAVSNSSPDGWTPGTGGTAATNQFGLIAEFAASPPASSAFLVTDALGTAVPGTAAALYGQAATKTAANGAKSLWLKLNMPTGLSVGTGGAQTMTLSVNGQGT